MDTSLCSRFCKQCHCHCASSKPVCPSHPWRQQLRLTWPPFLLLLWWQLLAHLAGQTLNQWLAACWSGLGPVVHYWWAAESNCWLPSSHAAKMSRNEHSGAAQLVFSTYFLQYLEFTMAHLNFFCQHLPLVLRLLATFWLSAQAASLWPWQLSLVLFPEFLV